ncbi:hypothetical protein [Actinocatenispora rupis]|uniref:Uncharacterized protein n=1 Tax=Actinocatenispora rupis TaxID=519421 RepID=A0A8J3NEN4_9ACTN|nr:hypothetical protein [Actinocatenispora rupis]GID14257.1 hypothetical protein Aru02nite_51460 [Actinocatenispora rupis]
MIRRMIGAVAAVIALLAGLWLALAPFALGTQGPGGWSRATTVTVVSGGAVAFVALVGFVASVAGLVGDARRRARAADRAALGIADGAERVAAQGFPQGAGYPQASSAGPSGAGEIGMMVPGSPPSGGWGNASGTGEYAPHRAGPDDGSAGSPGSTSDVAGADRTASDPVSGNTSGSDPATRSAATADADGAPPATAGQHDVPDATIDLRDLMRIVLPALTQDLDARRRAGTADGEFPRRPTTGVNGRIGPAWSGFLHPTADPATSHPNGDRPATSFPNGERRNGSDPGGGHPGAAMADAVRGRTTERQVER